MKLIKKRLRVQKAWNFCFPGKISDGPRQYGKAPLPLERIEVTCRTAHGRPGLDHAPAGREPFHSASATLQLSSLVRHTDALSAHGPCLIDAWYLDGFNPKTNPDLWSLELMQALHTKSNIEAQRNICQLHSSRLGPAKSASIRLCH